MYGQIDSNGKIKNLCSWQIEDFAELPDGATVGDFVKDGKSYTPPNSYSVLSAVKKGEPVWTEDSEAKNTATDVLRRTAYREESDPIFFKEQRGEVDSGTWAAKVAEIKAKYPKISA